LANSLFVQQFYKSTKKLGQETRSPIQLWFSPITNTYKQQCERLSTTCFYCILMLWNRWGTFQHVFYTQQYRQKGRETCNQFQYLPPEYCYHDMWKL